jgi:Cdc6-like AAA superfamily ATPase
MTTTINVAADVVVTPSRKSPPERRTPARSERRRLFPDAASRTTLLGYPPAVSASSEASALLPDVSSDGVIPEQVFTPRKAPEREMFTRRNEPDLLGNPGLQDSLRDALREPGGQVILYGDTGVGKSTLLKYAAGR